VRVVVLGAGAVGSLLGARLSGAGHHVVLVGRSDHLEAIRAHGLRIEGTDPGTFRVEGAPDARAAQTADVVLLTVKSFDLAEAAGALGRAAPPRPTLLPQNGLGIEAIALRALADAGWAHPEREVVRAIHSIPATWVAPGVVRAAGNGEFILPDPSHGEPDVPPVGRFVELLRSTGYPVRTVATFPEQVWRKAIVNAAINPVTALHGVVNGALLEGPLRLEALALLREAVRSAAEEGVRVPEKEAVEEFERIARATAGNRSSMLQDLERGRPTELDAILGEIERRARSHGVDLPVTHAAIAALEARRAQLAPRGKAS
jgi:2-dehydropantoate 2-reductase